MKTLLIPCCIFLSINCQAQQSAFDHYSFQIPTTSFNVTMRAIQGGSFMMGDEDKVRVTVSDFWIGAYEITHDQFGVFLKDESITQGSKVDAITRPTAQYIDLSWNMGKEGGYPANSMSIDAALMFCRWLYHHTGIFYRLPTEAEWEYACRAGTTTIYPFGDDPKQLDQYVWHAQNSENKYQITGNKKPNPWGIHDMLGNVSEWTIDQYDEHYFKTIGSNPKDPTIPPQTRYPRSIRGGSYADEPSDIRPGVRKFSEPNWNQRDPQVPKSRWWLTDGMFAGFRILRPRTQPTKEDAEKFYTLYLGR